MLTRDDGWKQLQQHLLNDVLDAEMTEHAGAARYERSEKRQAYRNGYRPRALKTRVGELELQVPQSRDGSFSTELFGRYQRSEQAMVLAMMEMVLQGVSTRKVHTDALCGLRFSKSTVSRLCKQLDARVAAFRDRSLAQVAYSFVLVDAMVIKVRQGDAVQPMHLLLAVGINAEGVREILGFAVVASESCGSWSALFAQLQARGLQGVDLVVSEQSQETGTGDCAEFSAGTVAAVPGAFGAERTGPLSAEASGAPAARAAPGSSSKAAARAVFLAEAYGTKAAKSIDLLEEGLDAATAVLTLPWKYQRRLRNTNMVERLIEELRRRERVIRIFPNEPSADRLMGAVLVEWHETRMTGKRYFTMEEYHSD